jgi:alkanesulfonate monooxygenase SsuD/methylene tetrahydromethanopterin reductase-like flavin-dependent oxidoreductase (luciferase family)
MVPLSILDLSVVTTGTKPAAALRNSIDLARHADALGYVRYWLAEHHNLASVASPAPDLMIGQIAVVTSRCFRAGSTWAWAARRAPTGPPRTRCAAGSIAARATIFWSACTN